MSIMEWETLQYAAEPMALNVILFEINSVLSICNNYYYYYYNYNYTANIITVTMYPFLIKWYTK